MSEHISPQAPQAHTVLDVARALLQTPAPPKVSPLEALLASVAFAAAGIVLAGAIIMGPGWDQTSDRKTALVDNNNPQVIPKASPGADPKLMSLQSSPPTGLEISATPLPVMDNDPQGVTDAIPLTEDEIVARGEARQVRK